VQFAAVEPDIVFRGQLDAALCYGHDNGLRAHIERDTHSAAAEREPVPVFIEADFDIREPAVT